MIRYNLLNKSDDVELVVAFRDGTTYLEEIQGNLIRKRKLKAGNGEVLEYPKDRSHDPIMDWDLLYIEAPSNIGFNLEFEKEEIKPTPLDYYVKEYSFIPNGGQEVDQYGNKYDLHLIKFGHIDSQTGWVLMNQPGDIDVEDPPPAPPPPQNG